MRRVLLLLLSFALAAPALAQTPGIDALEGHWVRQSSNYNPNDGMRIVVTGPVATLTFVPETAGAAWPEGQAIWQGLTPEGEMLVRGDNGRFYPARYTLVGEDELHIDVTHNGRGNDQTWRRTTAPRGNAPSGYQTRRQGLNAEQSALWPTNTLSVCWENPTRDNQRGRDITQRAVERTWVQHSNVKFRGWESPCANTSQGIRIRIEDTEKAPHTKGLGTRLDGKPDGMSLNFSFFNWDPSCREADSTGVTWIARCIDYIAVHEFGHALGFAHEQDRGDAESLCQDQEWTGTGGGFYVTPYDSSSVMNYCNPRWTNWGRLSIHDIAGVQRLYGAPGRSRPSHDQALWFVTGGSRVDSLVLREWRTIGYAGEETLYTLDANGDGSRDVFHSDGETWKVAYAHGGSNGNHGRWQPVGRSQIAPGRFAFRDFDGDGATDIFYSNGELWHVAYAGRGASGGYGRWERINRAGEGNLRFGDFNGDGRADVFHSNGEIWKVSYGGTGRWQQINRAGEDPSSLRFGDFDGDGRTDVFHSDGSRWRVSYGAASRWQQINSAGEDPLAFRFGDFNGDGRTDVFHSNGQRWKVSYGGASRWRVIGYRGIPSDDVRVGDFDGDGTDDLFVRWDK